MTLFLAGAAVYLFAITSLGILLATIVRLDAAVRADGDPGLSDPQHALGRHLAHREHAPDLQIVIQIPPRSIS